MPLFERHLFICTNVRDAASSRGSCGQKGAEAVRERFKKELAARGLAGKVRANSAGCLDQCEQGCSVVVYPDEVWYGAVTPDDVVEIVEQHLVGGDPVQRLVTSSRR